ncbi:hypothetical protein SpAn4DRAFT_4629 [Sporomusa ovata]|uniref:Uncharacterized protein n=1 Tax=Sporomusa ovata TaxID=2378 RepID=A0A0U1KRT1_9FIRM|nr:hypothetical protein SpAn4DRAFT_4629 [Sporomusa ovata]
MTLRLVYIIYPGKPCAAIFTTALSKTIKIAINYGNRI